MLVYTISNLWLWKFGLGMTVAKLRKDTKPTTNPARGGRPSGLVNQGAAGAMRAHLAKHVASKLNLRPVTYSPPEYRSLMHGPVMP